MKICKLCLNRGKTYFDFRCSPPAETTLFALEFVSVKIIKGKIKESKHQKENRMETNKQQCSLE